MGNQVTAEVRPCRHWFRPGWQYRVATYGETHWGNGVVGKTRTYEKAVRLAEKYRAEIQANVDARLADAARWERLPDTDGFDK